MRVTGVIAEYNPLHGGHIAQLKRIREEGADYIIVAMSGDFVQRGEPALFDMATRTRTALLAGADLVIEIPVIFSTASAPDFASASTALLDRLGIVDELCFGSECGDIETLKRAAGVLCSEPPMFRETLQLCLRSGEPYPKAQAAALSAVLSDGRSKEDLPSFYDIFSSPNNILGMEYIRSLMMRRSSIKPVTYMREGQAYNDVSPVNLGHDHVAEGRDHPSASAIRQAVKINDYHYFDYLYNILPGSVNDIKAEPIFADDMSELLNEKILEVFSDLPKEGALEKFASFSDLTPELAASLYREALNFDTFSGRISAIKSKAYTYSRISRALLHLLLGITDEIVSQAKSDDYISYVRVLGFKRSSEGLLREVHRNCDLPLITKTAGAKESLSAGGKLCFTRDLYASHLYQSLVFDKYGTELQNEFTRPLIII